MADGQLGALATLADADSSPRLWERWIEAGESPQAYARFLIYRNAGPANRSLSKLGVSKALGTHWSAKFKWVKRVRAWDDYIAALADGIAAHRVVDARTRHADLGKIAVSKAKDAIEQLDPTKIEPADIIGIAELGVSTEREALGLGPIGTSPKQEQGSISVGVVIGSDSDRPAWLVNVKSDVPELTEGNGDGSPRSLRSKVLEANVGGKTCKP